MRVLLLMHLFPLACFSLIRVGFASSRCGNFNPLLRLIILSILVNIWLPKL
ncbi:unnamed protein product [Enterobius vermicularis]|uniref:7TM_GPCR_Srx domain-containing protein n=1 Tax=Enterobius vermicularis TaxID=51028 RepID=A0A0N4UWK2_ENTVE|nr:unnamed protein product [Enterobius vermicularis]